MSIDSKNKIEQEERPEPFATVLELAGEYGKLAVIEALNDLAEYDAEDPGFCLACREEESWLHFELEHLLERYAMEFLLPELPEVQINHGAILV